MTNHITLSAAIQQLTQQFQAISSTPRLDAECLVAHVVQQSRTYLFTYPEQTLTTKQTTELDALLQRRLTKEPIAYMIGHQHFWTLDLKVTPATLIPRPETEHIIEWALSTLPKSNVTIADLGTGSGAIASALASERPDWVIHATDLSAAALEIAKHNATANQLNQIEFFRGSWCDPLPLDTYDVIISNPPYIAPNDPHLSELKYEPYAALVAEKNGFAAFEAIIEQAKHKLNTHGRLVFEHGYNQQEKLADMLRTAGFNTIEQHCDLAQQARFTVAVR